MDLVSGAAVAGVAPGLSVLVAQSAAGDSHGNLLLTGMALGLGLGLPVLISIVFFHVLPWNFSAYPWLKGWLLPPEWVVAAIAGWLSIGMSMLNAYLIGARRQRAICGLAVFMAAAGIGIAASPHRRRRAIDVSPEISKLSGRREHRQTVPAWPPGRPERGTGEKSRLFHLHRMTPTCANTCTSIFN